jgi:hypothetical protein
MMNFAVTMTTQQCPSPQHSDHVAQCPSCGCTGGFSYAGQQHWPAQVAARAGINPDVTLWNCDSCDTTLSEPELAWL